MYLITKSGRKVLLNAPEEEAINRGIVEDPDTYELTTEEIRKMKPAGQFQAEGVEDCSADMFAIGISREIGEYFQATGDNW